jgi:hypothetical protein
MHIAHRTQFEHAGNGEAGFDLGVRQRHGGQVPARRMAGDDDPPADAMRRAMRP